MNDDWEMSGPEEGDKIDQRVFVCNVSIPGYEVIELKNGTTAQKKSAARKIAELLNKYEGRLA